MRFFKGFIGAGIPAALSLLVLLSPDTSIQDAFYLASISLVGSSVTAIAAAMFERESWGWGRYMLAGTLGYGGVMFGIFVMIGLALAATFNGSVPLASIMMLAACTGLIGAFTGAGYRLLAGAKEG